jgi:hypothetical protein
MPSSEDMHSHGSPVPTDDTDDRGTDRPEPEDRYNLVYCACLLCGASFLMPWNSITMAVDFFHTTYPGTSIMFAISISYITVIWLGATLSNMTVEWLNPSVKVIFGSLISMACLVYLAIVEAWLRPFSQDVSYHLVLLCCLLVSFGAASKLGPNLHIS